MTNNSRSEISLNTGYLPCGFAYINRHSHQTLFQVLTLADIVHFGLLSPPCTFSGIQIIQHSEYRFFALSSTAGCLLSGWRQPSHPARIFSGICWIRFIYYSKVHHVADSSYSIHYYFYSLLPTRWLQAHVTLLIRFQVVIQQILLRSFHTRWTQIFIPCLVLRENNST